MPRIPHIASSNHPAYDSIRQFLLDHENGVVITVVPKDGEIGVVYLADKHFEYSTEDKNILEKTLVEMADGSIEQVCSDMQQLTKLAIQLFRVLTISKEEAIVHTTTIAMIGYLFRYAMANTDLFDKRSGLIEFVDEGGNWFVGDYGRPASLTPTRH